MFAVQTRLRTFTNGLRGTEIPPFRVCFGLLSIASAQAKLDTFA